MNDESEPLRQIDPASAAIATIDAVAPSGWRTKMAKAAAQLLLGARKGAAVYAVARDNFDEVEGRSAMNRQLYALATQQIVSDPEIIEHYKSRLLNDLFRKTDNLEAVVKGAETMTLALPGPEHASRPDQPELKQDAPLEDDDDGEPLQSDWVSTFVPLAECADSDELRDRLSRILAGELRSPGTFPRSTIRAISELEKSDIEALLSVSASVVGDYILDKASMDLETTNSLLEAGLIHDSSARTFKKTISASANKPSGLTGSKLAISITVDSDFSYTFTGVPLTRLGRSVLSLLDGYNELKALTDFVNQIPKDGVTYITIGEFNFVKKDVFRIRNPSFLYIRYSSGPITS